MKEKIVFLRQNGEVATNAIKQGPPNKETGEIPFMEILDIGREKVVGGKLLIKGKEVYQRIFVQRVYPHITMKKHHTHKWIPSVNTKCQRCDGSTEMCEKADCRTYRCTNEKSWYCKKGKNRYFKFWIENDVGCYKLLSL